MKKLMIITMLLSFGFIAHAQQTSKREMPSPQQRAEKMTERIAEKLELTEDQKLQIYEINLKNAEKRQEEMVQRRAGQEERRTEMKKQQDDIKAVLSPEQIAKWEEVKKESIQNRERYSKHRGASSQHHRRSGAKSQ